MKLVVDTNCLISALIKDGKTRELICSSQIKLYAPEHIISETINHKLEILKKSNLDENDFGLLINILLSQITIISKPEFEPCKEEALKLVTHPEDSPFIALAIHLQIPLWSNDEDLKLQNRVKIYSTKELLEIMTY